MVQRGSEGQKNKRYQRTGKMPGSHGNDLGSIWGNPELRSTHWEENIGLRDISKVLINDSGNDFCQGSRIQEGWWIQLSSVTQSCLTLCDPMDCSMSGFPVLHHLLESAQTHVHWVGDAIQPSHPLSSPYPPAFNLSQHQGLFKWVSLSHQVAKVLEFQFQHQSFQWIFRTDFL